MELPHLDKMNWSDITREELFFCAELYFSIKGNESDFVKWLNTLESMQKLGLDSGKDWEVAFEVCFYRDLFKTVKSSAREKGFSNRRTFDLCLFSKDEIAIIEAKAQSRFKRKQLNKFDQDKQRIPEAIKLALKNEKENEKKGVPKAIKLPWKIVDDIKVYILALASSQYFVNMESHGAEKKIPAVFDGFFSWMDIYNSFSHQDIFFRADNIYKK